MANFTTTGSDTFPQYQFIQTRYATNSTVQAIAGNANYLVYNGQYITAKQANSTYIVALNSSVVSFAATTNPDVTDLGVQIRWGTSSGAVTNEFGPSHSHRFNGGSHFNTNVNFFSVDGNVQNAVGGSTWAGHEFTHHFAQNLTIAAGATLYWKVWIWGGSGTVYWNRAAASATSNIGHSTLQITEVAS